MVEIDYQNAMSANSTQLSSVPSPVSSLEVASLPTSGHSRARRQGIFWMLTIPGADYVQPESLPDGITWIAGQQERGGGQNGYWHWQICLAVTKKTSLRGIKSRFGDGIHAELTRSAAANDYVKKTATSVEGRSKRLLGF
jgi:hypothetical protein